MGSFEEEGELQARARARGAVRSLHVHVPTARAWRLQVGQGADPGVRHLRRVQAPVAILTRATSLWGAQTRSCLQIGRFVMPDRISAPHTLTAQLAEGGRLVQPIGSGGDEEVVLFAKRDGTLDRLSTLAGARFVSLIGRHGLEG